jgi:hypothetical protein
MNHNDKLKHIGHPDLLRAVASLLVLYSCRVVFITVDYC